jgi:transcriptional regulator GlxA family with amidase domain
MVVPAHRQGGQAQRVEAPVPLHRQSGAEALAAVLDWAVENLDKDLSVQTLAARAHMSERTLARRFRQLTGVTPYQWLLSQRLAQAQRLLENGASVEETARRSGFRGAATLRSQFSRWNGRSPSEYARAFRPAG